MFVFLFVILPSIYILHINGISDFKINLSHEVVDIYKNIFISIVSLVFGGLITLWLTTWKERREGRVRFRNRLISVAHEVKVNFKDVGSAKNPFQTKALEKLVYDEPLVHKHPELFDKSLNCLHAALILSTSANPKLRPGHGQQLMKELSEFLEKNYGINLLDEPE